MRRTLPARLAIMGCLAIGLTPQVAGIACAAPAIPPVPPAPPVSGVTAKASGPLTPETLLISKTCLSHLSVTGGAEPHIVSGPGQLKVSGNALTFEGPAHDCGPDDRTVLMVRPQSSIDIRPPRNAPTTYSITGVNGDVTATTERGNLNIDSATSLTLSMMGPGDVNVGHVTGRMVVQAFSSGDMHADSIQTSSASLTAMSSGDIRINGGQTDVLTIRNYGSADVTLSGSAHDADLTLMGSGSITLDKVSETLKKRPLGSGTISVASTSGARITTIDTPDNSAVFSDTAKELLDQLHIQFSASADHLELSSMLGESASSSRSQHNAHGKGWNILLKIILVIGVIRLYRRYRRTGLLPFRNTVDRMAAGYTAVVRSWEDHRSTWHESRARWALTLFQDGFRGLKKGRQVSEQDLSARMPPGHPLARLQDRLARLEPRISRMEQFVTSPDFSLEREFRNLEQTGERRA